jgi:succinoglycan biosynthesis protein ExoM
LELLLTKKNSGVEIVIGICAASPSNRLNSLIDAIASQTKTVDFQCAVAVVANCWTEADFRSFENSYRLGAPQNIRVEIIPEETKGIPFARNTALNFALGSGCRWLAFIDDDCVPEEEWLKGLVETAIQLQADAVAGAWELRSEGAKSRWLPAYVFGLKAYEIAGIKVRNNQPLRTAYTRSVLLDVSSESLVSRLALRFDTARAELGGSDVLFFDKVRAEGGKIFFASLSRVVEFYSGDRLTVGWWFWRKYRNAQFRFERGELSVHQVLLGVLRLSKTLGAYVLAAFVPQIRKKEGTAREAIGHLVLSSAPLLGLLGYRVYRFKSYPNEKSPGGQFLHRFRGTAS